MDNRRRRPMAPGRRPGGPRGRTRHQHGPDARHELRRRDHPRPRGRGETMGRDRRHPPEGQDRGAPSRGGGERDLCGQRTRPDALGRAARIRGRGRPRRFHLRAALRPPPGDQRQRRDAASPACWCAAARSRWWSISICRAWSRIRIRWSGSTTFIRRGGNERSERASINEPSRHGQSNASFSSDGALASASAYSVSSGPTQHAAVPGQAPSIPGVPNHAPRAGAKIGLIIRAMNCSAAPAPASASARSATGGSGSGRSSCAASASACSAPPPPMPA